MFFSWFLYITSIKCCKYYLKLKLQWIENHQLIEFIYEQSGDAKNPYFTPYSAVVEDWPVHTTYYKKQYQNK